MRQELRDFEWHKYGLSVSDFDFTIELINSFIDCRNAEFEKSKERLSKKYAEERDIYHEIISDLGHYNYIENQFLYHFALTRSQGIFEGILKQEFFPDKKLIGLKKKLRFVKGLKYNIETADFDAIIEWGDLRNALSHFPPEQFQPGLLNQDDVNEYMSLAKKILKDLKEQKNKK